MNILLTGAFGNVGLSTLEMLLKQGQSVKCFDIKNSKNLKSQKKLLKYSQFETIWGDITNLDDISRAVQDVSNIIHLAAIIAPLSEKIPEIAYKVNVEGTSLLIKAAKQLRKPPKFILASSVSVFGKKMNEPPPRKVNHPISPTDNYTRHKVEVEKILQKSGLPWLILRLGAVTPLNLPTKLDPIFFEIPLDQRIEFLYTKDAGMAFANAVSYDINNKILLIGGGKGCQLYQREFIKKLLNAIGISMLPESAFKPVKKKSDWFYTDWMDTQESQELLNYQSYSFDQYINKLKKLTVKKRFGLRLVSPLVKFSLLLMSPYYKFFKSNKSQLNS